MKIKTGDKVMVIAGKYKGTVGEVIKAYPREHKVLVDGVNVHKKAVKPNQANPEGGMVDYQLPIDVSNVMLYDEKAKKAGRVGYRMEKGKKVRYNKKTGATVKAG